MYKRRKRAKYIWLPSQWSFEDTGVSTPTNAIDNNLPVGVSGDPNITFSPVVLDSTLEDTDVPNFASGQPTDVTITDIVQANEYFLKRIVGNLWIGVRQDDQSDMPAALVEAGLFVGRADDTNPETPMGAAASPFAGFDPAHPDTTREPWIWKKSWILSNQQTSSSSSYAWGGAVNYGIYDPGLRGGGNTIDQKTARRVRKDERLWLAVSTRCWPPKSTPYNAPLQVDYTREFRCLGQLRRATSRGAF